VSLIDSVPERFKNRTTAEAIMAPSGILLAGAGAAAAILGGLPLVAAAGIGLAAYGIRVAIGLPRRKGEKISPNRLADPWKRFVHDALDARRRYDQACATASEGPLRTRLVEIGQRLDAAVQEVWRIARRGNALVEGIRQLDTNDARRQLAYLQGGADSEARRGTIAALEAQLASADRLEAVAVDARDRLQLMDARLDEAVARAIELSLRAEDVGELHGLGNDVDNLVGEMESLRQGLDEAGQAAAGVA
jgi:hypothetical protein